MTIYVCIFLLGVAIAYFIKNKKILITFFGLSWFALLSFRNLHMGLYDTLGTYYDSFKNVKTLVRANGNWLSPTAGPLYSILILCFRLFSDNYHLFISLIGLIVVLSICCLIYFNSSTTIDVLLESAAFFSLFYFYSYFLIRQFIAIALICSFAFPSLVRKDKIKFVLSVIVAGLIHPTAFIFLLAFPVFLNCRYTLKILFASVIISAIGIILPSIVFSFVNFMDLTNSIITYYKNGVYSNGGGIPGTWFVYVFLLVAICLLGSKLTDFDNTVMWIVDIGVIFLGWSCVIGEFYRIAIYFLIFAIFLFPKFRDVCSIQMKNRRFVAFSSDSVGLLVLFFLLIYMVFISANNAYCNPYVPYWNIWHDFVQWRSSPVTDPGNI